MTLADLNTPRGWTGIAIGALLLGGSVWGVSALNRSPEPGVDLPPELTVEAIKASAANPGQAMGNMRAFRDREDLTDEQRRQARENMREVFQATMNERVNEYFSAPDDLKVVVLDQHIDSMEAWRKATEAQRKEMEKREEGQRDPARGFTPRSRDDRKARSESQDPDQSAQRMAYFMALQSRMTERGIKMPWGGGRGGFGGSGGRRGGP